MIYFIQETGLFRNRVKIGLTSNLKDRLSALRGTSPSRLKVLLTLPGDVQAETDYHERFTKYRLHGEWFKFGLHLRLFIWRNQFNLSSGDESGMDSSVLNNEPKESEIQIVTLEVKHVEERELSYMESVNLPDSVTREMLTEWSESVVNGTKTPARSNWAGSGKLFSRDSYDGFVKCLLESGILTAIPGKGKQLSASGKHALKQLINNE